MGANSLEDSFGRRFSYLRLSVTDACNFRCVYCLPNGYQRSEGAEDHLSLAEIRNLVSAFTELGMWKIRLTGGEPTLRRDLLEIITMISENTAVKKIALSTNGYRLKQMAGELRLAGVSAVNVSVDTLNAQRFSALTGSGQLPEILEGIEAAIALGFESVKINAVLMKDTNESELALFLSWIRRRPVSVRFIELMPTGQTEAVFKKHHLQSNPLRMQLLEQGWTIKPRGPADGPAIEMSHPDFQGSIGLIAPYSTDFCATCNRLRISSTGGLRLCLFAEGNHSLRHLLQRSSQKEDLKQTIHSLLNKKEVSHYLPEGRYGNNQTFSSIGG
ncbi:MAG: GTP 3',8-cyclase MoaA [Deltaproteobacteria bacterium]|nr:GTP 3',8-cyclase MoaA [Deltaproteobacteria bacterium]